MKTILVFFSFFGYNQGVLSALRGNIPISLELEGVQGSKSSYDRKLDICDENIILNSDGNSVGGPLDQWEPELCMLTSINDGYLPGSKAFKVNERVNVNAGPKQQFSDEQLNCLNEGVNMTISLRMKLEDENGDSFACNGATWNTASTCPIVSFWVQPEFGSSFWANYWNDADLEETGGWQADEWNEFTSTFLVSSEMANANNIYFTIRGPAIDITVYMSDPIFTFTIPSSESEISSNEVSTLPPASPTPLTIPSSTPPPPTPLPTLSPTPSPNQAPPSDGNGPSSSGPQGPTRGFLFRKRSRIKSRSYRPIPN